MTASVVFQFSIQISQGGAATNLIWGETEDFHSAVHLGMQRGKNYYSGSIRLPKL